MNSKIENIKDKYYKIKMFYFCDVVCYISIDLILKILDELLVDILNNTQNIEEFMFELNEFINFFYFLQLKEIYFIKRIINEHKYHMFVSMLNEENDPISNKELHEKIINIYKSKNLIDFNEVEAFKQYWNSIKFELNDVLLSTEINSEKEKGLLIYDFLYSISLNIKEKIKERNKILLLC